MTTPIALFTSFKNLGFGLLKGDLLNEEKKKLEAEINEYLKNGMVEFVLIYVGSGYVLNSRQKTKLLENFDSISPRQVMNLFNRVLERGVEISDEILAHTFFQLSDYLKTYESYYESEPAMKLFFQKIQEEKFTNKVYELWINHANRVLKCNNSNLIREKVVTDSDSSTRNILVDSIGYSGVIVPFESFGRCIFKNKKLEDFSLAMEKIKKLVNKFEKAQFLFHNSLGYSRAIKAKVNSDLRSLKGMRDAIATYSSTLSNKDEIVEKQQKIGILYDSGELAKLVAAENIKLSEGNDIKNLPASAKNHLEQIKRDYLSLNKKLDDLTEEERFNINNLWSKRIPEIINKYLRADPMFRKTMKDMNGKTIEDLLNDSLVNIHEVLKQIQQFHTENTLMEMSALNRYAKALR